MLRPLRTLLRLIAIARILARHDALAPLQELQIAPGVARVASLLSRRKVQGRPGQKLAAALTELGPSFIKLGQFLSTRADLLGEQMAGDLSELQDALPPFPAAAARRTLEQELAAPIDEVFESFDDTPVSAASIAQVHFAVTREAAGESEDEAGREVAVKILRPGVEAAVARDVELFYDLAALAERTQPRLRRFKPTEVVALFDKTIRLEMDLRMEAAAASELAENFADDPTYRVPPIDWQRSSQRVLTMGRAVGIPIDDRAALIAAGHNLEKILTKAAEIFFNQVFRDGFFHGDQHPGNMWVDAQGNVVVVDFGIMGRLDRKTRTYLADMLLATLARDYRRLAEVQLEAGYLPAEGELEVFAQALRTVCEPIFGRPLREISFARLLAQLLQLTESFAMPVQPQLLLLQKNMLMAEGISRRLDAELNIWSLAQPLIEDWVRENRGPEARLRDSAFEALETLRRLPGTVAEVEQVARELAGGGMRLHPDTVKALGREGGGWRWQQWLPWLIVGALVLALLID